MEREGKTFKVGLRKHFKSGSNSITWVCKCGNQEGVFCKNEEGGCRNSRADSKDGSEGDKNMN